MPKNDAKLFKHGGGIQQDNKLYERWIPTKEEDEWLDNYDDNAPPKGGLIHATPQDRLQAQLTPPRHENIPRYAPNPNFNDETYFDDNEACMDPRGGGGRRGRGRRGGRQQGGHGNVRPYGRIIDHGGQGCEPYEEDPNDDRRYGGNREFFGGLKKPKIDFPKFNGNNPHKWLDKAKHYFDVYGIDDEERVDVSMFYLEGRASNWFRWIRTNIPRIVYHSGGELLNTNS